MASNIKDSNTSLEIAENDTIVVEDGIGTTRLVTQQDGSKVPFSETQLRASLNR